MKHECPTMTIITEAFQTAPRPGLSSELIAGIKNCPKCTAHFEQSQLTGWEKPNRSQRLQDDKTRPNKMGVSHPRYRALFI